LINGSDVDLKLVTAFVRLVRFDGVGAFARSAAEVLIAVRALESWFACAAKGPAPWLCSALSCCSALVRSDAMRPADAGFTDVRLRSVKVERSAVICAQGSAAPDADPLALAAGAEVAGGVELLELPMLEEPHAATRATPLRLRAAMAQCWCAVGFMRLGALFITPCYPRAVRRNLGR